MSLQDYYNVLPATHKSPAPSPTSSEDSGIPVEESGVGMTSAPPARPPRARDEPATHEYHNLPPFGHDYQNTDDAFFGFRRRALTPPPPRLPKRQPALARPKTPPPPVLRRPYNNNNNSSSNNNNRNPPSMSLLQQHPHLAARSSSVSSSASTVASTANSQQPFRRRFQVRKKRSGGSCKCKAPAGRASTFLTYSCPNVLIPVIDHEH